MTYPEILGIGTALPDKRLGQAEIFDSFLAPHFGKNRHARAIFAHAGVDYRHVAVDGSFYGRQRTTEERNNCYIEHAVPLGTRAIEQCLRQTGLTAQQIDNFLIVSCTGLDTPGLDLLLAGKLGMRPDLRRATILGMGCYGAFPALTRARDAVAAGHDRAVLVLSIELCSLHFQFDDDLENIVASALFSDGAAAAIVGRSEDASRQRPQSVQAPVYPAIIDTTTFCDYQTLEHMAFHVTDHGFRMRLSSYVPNVLGANVPHVLERLLKPRGLQTSDIHFWAVHPGSSKILDYVQDSLGLDRSALDSSRAVLRSCGNMSSATILFVLDEMVRNEKPTPGDYGVLLAFGPGLTIESALVQW